MTDLLCLLRELFYSIQNESWKGHLLLLDQVKAFDKVNHNYLWTLLKAKGIPPLFITWIQLLFANAKVIPQINGWRGDPITLHSGVRQGCPLSPLLYVFALDPILIRIQREPHLRRLSVSIPPPCEIFPGGRRKESDGIAEPPVHSELHSKFRVKFVAHADDVTLLLLDENEISVILDLFWEYGKISGSELNADKSVFVKMDRGRQQLSCLPISECKSEGAPESKLKWVDTVNILEIEYGIKEKVWGGNWTDWEEKVMLKITMWKKWNFAMYQKALYIRTYPIPPVHNLAVVYPPPLNLLQRVDSQIFHLVWHTASFPLARAVAYKEVERGGLALPALQPYFVTEFMSYNFGNWIS
ncbi:LIM and SH3 domain protein 1 isoform X2 [Hemicordylus capensis]|uniref:LIM and SH3 domain protein 1 isoform X2 n=1 Tax=Hemicordylus capensis TaxID=884348 RepID=UPI0023041477|nr:LIM and SH3 domain protein 1 isoform X2 [Hemicordylus capensis]XP_053115219.1 LIM and SH3 domain protein 1 isoform X2 [Hemicordylus capensis]XP_053115220.1 LIM and SH3 domain protein 1 isoform X2 [Hemicordylus capensis]XP_053115221.1 LIM and SH3 domain protein 1 isoform X2 [Hemicordylus capensis]